MNKGQTLVTLLLFMAIAIIVTSAATIVIFTNSLATSKFQDGITTYYIAESGAENAFLRLLRNPNYTGETLPVDSGSASIQVTGTGTKIITSIGTMGNFTRTVQIQATYANNILTITSWKEVF